MPDRRSYDPDHRWYDDSRWDLLWPLWCLWPLWLFLTIIGLFALVEWLVVGHVS